MTQYFWQANANTIDQGLIDFGKTENRPASIDVKEQLAEGELSPVSPSAVCYLLDLYGERESDATSTILAGSASVSGTSIVTPVVQGPAMTVGRFYEIVLTHGIANNRRSVNVTVRAVE